MKFLSEFVTTLATTISTPTFLSRCRTISWCCCCI